jgi:hypothetical protein
MYFFCAIKRVVRYENKTMSNSFELNCENLDELKTQLTQLTASFKGPFEYTVALNRIVDLVDLTIELLPGIKRNDAAFVGSQLPSSLEYERECFFSRVNQKIVNV